MAKRKKKETVEEHSMAKVLELEKEIFILRNERAIHRKLEKPHLLKQKRHERARILTVLSQKEKAQ
jgi:ribosomal protein L29